MPLFVFLFLIVLPIAEIFAIILVADTIGLPATILALMATSALGVVLVRSQGRAVIARFRATLAQNRPPAAEALDGALVFVGGSLLIVPGFITDIAGALLLAPPTRSLARRLVISHYGGWVLRWGRRVARGRHGYAYDVDSTVVEAAPRELTR
jgi:UPF0716 protein FxsA